MKSAQIDDFLKIWSASKNLKWERIKARKNEQQEEFLIGNTELPFTKKIKLNRLYHFITSFNEKVNDPIKKSISSLNAKRLTDKEILFLINNPYY
jgi:hypothetical protein